LRRKSKDKRLGWSPPPQIQVSIAKETYHYIKEIAASKSQTICPIYETLQEIIREFAQLKEDFQVTEEFLAERVEDKRVLKEENTGLQEDLAMAERSLAVAMEENEQLKRESMKHQNLYQLIN